MYKTQEGIDARNALNMLYESGLREVNQGKGLSETQEKIFVKIWQNPNESNKSIAEELNLSESVVRMIVYSMFKQIENLIGVKIQRSTLRISVTDFLKKSPNVDDFEGVIQGTFAQIDLAQARIIKEQEEIQVLAKETDDLLNQLEYKAR